MLSDNIKDLKPSPTLLINETSKRLIREGEDIIKFGFGQSPFPVPTSVVNALKANAHQKNYLPGKGLFELRDAVANFNNRTLGLNQNAENISIGPGSKELIFSLQLAFKGDLILPAPSWVSYEPQAQILGKKTWWVDTTESENWLISPSALEDVCRQITNPKKILLLNYPNNPTGASYSVSQIKALIPVLKKYNILLLADEIYGELNFEDNHHSFANYYPEDTIVSSGLSKWCGAGGWRLGTFSFPDKYKYLQDGMATIASETFSAVAAPIQYAAITAFKGNAEIDLYLKKSRLILGAIASYLHAKLLKLDITMPYPSGGFYLFPNFKNYKERFQKSGISTNTELCSRLLAEIGIALLPGLAFGRPEEELTARLSFVDFDGAAALQNFDLNKTTINNEFLHENFSQIITGVKRLEKWLTQ